MTLTEKWTTDNSLNTTVDVVDKLVAGLKLSLDTKFAPGTGAKSGSLKTEYKHEAAMVTADMDLAFSAINASAVVGQKGWLAGYRSHPGLELRQHQHQVRYRRQVRPGGRGRGEGQDQQLLRDWSRLSAETQGWSHRYPLHPR